MTDSVPVEEEEQRLRDRLKAKSQMRRDSLKGSSSPPNGEKDPAGRNNHNQQQGHNSASPGGSSAPGSPSSRGHRDGSSRGGPHHGKGGRGGTGRGGNWRRNEQQVDPYGRGPPPPHLRNNPNGDRFYGRGGGRGGGNMDRYGREIRRDRSPHRHHHRHHHHHRGRRSRSLSRSRSYSRSSDEDDESSRSEASRDSRDRRDRRHNSPRNRRHRSHRHSRSRSRSPVSSESESDSESSQSSVESRSEQQREEDKKTNMYTKDQRTVFVSQLVQRTVERDIKKYFSKEKNLKVNEVILLRDKRTGRHKGCAYVELRRMEDVSNAVALSNVAPSFQRFPILIKSSEAEKNYASNTTTTPANATAALTATQMVPKTAVKPLLGPDGKLLEAQKVYVGSLDPSVTQEHLFVLFRQFGQLHKVSLQVDTATGISKGFAFLSFQDPKESNLAIQTMANQVLAGRPIKTGWAVNQNASIPGAQVVTSNEFPPDGSARATNAYKVLAQLTMGVPVSQIDQIMAATEGASDATTAAATVATVVPQTGVSRIPTVAEARASLAAGGSVVMTPTALTTLAPAVTLATTQTNMPSSVTDPTKVGNADQPTNHILVHNMYDKDQETDPGWENEIKLEFEEECSKFGKILEVTVMAQEVGGKIYASFDTVQGAQSCASSLAGRWFDKRQLCVEFVKEGAVPP